MGIVSIDASNAIQSCVEAMLPRFSDSALGVLVGLDMGLSDYGYGKDGNTEERPELHVRKFPWFLFVRPNNYTKVYFWMPSDDARGLACSPPYGGKSVWTEIADHDSCWRDAVEHKLNEVYFEMSERFEGRKIGKDEMRPCDLGQHISFQYSTPCLVRLERLEQVNKDADRFSPESRPHNVSLVRVEWKDVASDDKSRLKLKG